MTIMVKLLPEQTVVTAGKPHHIKLEADKQVISANGVDLSYVTATIVDKQNLCPTASNRLYFEVKGNGKYRAACNGDATSLEVFHEPTMKAFNGKLVILVQSSTQKGDIELIVSGDELPKAEITISSVE
jgi:beta-galactosidase